MASMTNHPDGSIVRTPEYVNFIGKLQEFHRQRGTLGTFDPEPRVGVKHLNLLQLFDIVVQRGGYDKISDEKLAWRKLGTDLQLGMSNLPAQAFSLKSVYYKQLAAYEIKTIHNQDPPPKEILEDITAKGGNLLTRTVENFKAKTKDAANAQDDDGDDEGTPARDALGHEDTPGSGGRSTRGLRQAPPQRVLFQPDTLPARQRGHIQAPSVSTPQPPRGASTYNPPSNPENMSQMVANYEPRPPTSMIIRAISTPGNDSVHFAKRQRQLREQSELFATRNRPAAYRIMLPGTGFEGPNIYLRCLQSLKSKIFAEEDYALHHLVKISMERGEKYRFESFAGLAEALIEKGLGISQLFYNIQWTISYVEDSMAGTQILDGVNGTEDILARLAAGASNDIDDTLQSEGFLDKMLHINEAALTLRNMVMLEENAFFVSKQKPLKDFLSIVLTLPDLNCVVELKYCALEIAEQITRYLILEDHDPLYLALLKYIDSDDRGMILTALHAVSRISANLEAQNYLRGIPVTTIQKLIDTALLDDDELRIACLDFFYQYTAVVANVDILVTDLTLWPFVQHLVNLLSYGNVTVKKEYVVKPPVRLPGIQDLPPIPAELLTKLLTLEEPRRSSEWLKCHFEEDKDESITQIALWQAYQSRFASTAQETGQPLLAAAEFIKNVSTTFADKAAAQVEPGPVQRFIIKGIRIREIPVDMSGKEYNQCSWTVVVPETPVSSASTKQCGHFFMGAQQMYEHVVEKHLGAKRSENGAYGNTKGNYLCAWKGCRRFPVIQNMMLKEIAVHLKQHLPIDWNAKGRQTSSASAGATETNGRPSSAILATAGAPGPQRQRPWYTPAVTRSWTWSEGPVDDRGEAIGIPLAAVLVLRNLARNLPKTESEEQIKEHFKRSRDRGETLEYHGLIDLNFRAVKHQVAEIWAHNKSLAMYLSDLFPMISGGGV